MQAYRNGTPHKVGAFFESFAFSLLGLDDSEDCDGDLNGKKHRLGVEVKGSDNNHNWRLSVPQLDGYLALSSFPFDGAIYCLVGYKNKNGRRAQKQGTPLTQAHQEDNISQFLARSMNCAYIFDALLVEALAKQGGTVSGTLFGACRDKETVVVSRQWINELFANPEQVLAGLEIPASDWYVRKHQIWVGHRMGDAGRAFRPLPVGYAVRKELKGTISTNGNGKHKMFVVKL